MRIIGCTSETCFLFVTPPPLVYGLLKSRNYTLLDNRTDSAALMLPCFLLPEQSLAMLQWLVLNNKPIWLASFCTWSTENGQVIMNFRHSDAMPTTLQLHICLYPIVEDCSDDKSGTTFQNYSITLKNKSNRNWIFAPEITHRGDVCIILITNCNQIGIC